MKSLIQIVSNIPDISNDNLCGLIIHAPSGGLNPIRALQNLCQARGWTLTEEAVMTSTYTVTAPEAPQSSNPHHQQGLTR